MVTPIVLTMGGGESSQTGWRIISTIYAVLCTIFVAGMAFIKEKKLPAEMDNSGEVKSENVEQKIGYKDALKYVLTTKYTWILLAFYFLFTLYSGVSGGIGYYNFIYVVKDTSYFGIISTAGTLASMICFFFVPKLFGTFGKKKTMKWAMIIFVIANLATYIDPRSPMLLGVVAVIKSFMAAPISVLQFVLVADLTDYIFQKHKVSISHVVAMTSSVGIKVGTGLGSAVVGWGLALIGFNALEAVQTSFTENGIIFMGAAIPAICGVIMAILISMWDMDEKRAE